MGRITLDEYEAFIENDSTPHNSYVSKFYLKDIGDEAIVRFNIDKIEDLKIYSTHSLWLDNGYKDVECLRIYRDDAFSKCPLCKSNNKVNYKIYIPLLVYECDDNGNWRGVPKMWPQSLKFRDTLKDLCDANGDLRNKVFKVVKINNQINGYSISTPDWKFYKPEFFTDINFTIFNNFLPYDNKYLLVKMDYDEMTTLIDKDKKENN